MAKSKLAPFIESISGKLGNAVFRTRNGKTVIAKRPDMSNVESSEAQMDVREAFSRASRYSDAVMDDPEALAPYAKAAEKSTDLSARNIIMQDYLSPPTVDDIDLSGYSGSPDDVIAISAHDVFEVADVTVTITDESTGEEMESGSAEYVSDGRWSYRVDGTVEPGTTVVISAVAEDRPGNTAEKEAEVVV